MNLSSQSASGLPGIQCACSLFHRISTYWRRNKPGSSNVDIHTGAKAAEAAEAIDAKAFTCGNDIVFNSGEYDTESLEGQHLLAHELAHVKQQNGGASISMMPQEGANLVIDLEHESNCQ